MPIHAADQEIDFLQPFERLQEHLSAARAQVRAFDQQIAEIAGDVGVREVVLVMRAGREQRDARVIASAVLRERALHVVEIGGHPHGIVGVEDVARDMRVNHPVGEREAHASQCLGMIVDDAPLPVRTAREIGRIEPQSARARQHTAQRMQIRAVREHQLRRQVTVAEKRLIAIEIVEHAVEQLSALDERPLQRHSADENTIGTRSSCHFCALCVGSAKMS